MIDIKELRDLYIHLNGRRPANREFVGRLGTDLGIELPDDFLAATEFFDGSGVAVLALHPISPDIATNVLSETLRLRTSIKLPNHLLVLGEPPESLLTLNCISGEVIWCDASDAGNLGKAELIRAPQIWSSYREFLYSLLKDEEIDRDGT